MIDLLWVLRTWARARLYGWAFVLICRNADHGVTFRVAIGGARPVDAKCIAAVEAQHAHEGARSWTMERRRR